MPTRNIRRKSRKQAGRSIGGLAQLGAVAPWSSLSRQPELKMHTLASSNQALYHNTAAQFGNVSNFLDGVAVGTGYYTRIGNQIRVKRLVMRLVLNRKTDRPNVSYRVIVLATVPGSGVDAFSELFEGSAFTSICKPGVCQVLHDVVFPRDQGGVMTQQVTPDKERSNTYECSIDIDRAVAYSTDGSCLTVVRGYIIAYDAYGTLTTDNIASIPQGLLGVQFIDT